MFSGYYTKLREHKFHRWNLVVEETPESIQLNSLMFQRKKLNLSNIKCISLGHIAR